MAKYIVPGSSRALLADLNISVSNVLRRAELPRDLFAQGSVELEEQPYFALWQAIEDEADDPDLPVRISEAFSAEIFDPPIFAALLSPNLNIAAERLSVHKKLVCPMRLDVRITDELTDIALVWPSGSMPQSTLVLTDLLFWVSLVRIATRHRVDPVRISAPQVPADQSAYIDYLGVPVTEAPEPSIRFAGIDATRPFLTSNDALWRTFEPELRRQLHELEAEATTTERVRATLLELLPTGQASMSEVGRALAMSTRTLHRRLQSESTTFQDVLDRTRESLARHYLADPGISAAEISFLLGYEETSSFYRAFHNWTGETPERVRAASA